MGGAGVLKQTQSILTRCISTMANLSVIDSAMYVTDDYSGQSFIAFCDSAREDVFCAENIGTPDASEIYALQYNLCTYFGRFSRCVEIIFWELVTVYTISNNFVQLCQRLHVPTNNISTRICLDVLSCQSSSNSPSELCELVS